MSQVFLKQIETAKEYLLKGDLEGTTKELDQISAQTPTEIRWLLHYKGIVQLRNGHYEQAVHFFVKALEENGLHMSVVLDLASAYLAWGRMIDWQRTLKIAENEFEKAQFKLSPERYKGVYLLLAKHYEESGQIRLAQEIYLNLHSEFGKGLTHYSAENYKIMSQLVRMSSDFDLQSISTDDFYSNLSTHHEGLSHKDCDFEVQHALLTYEIKNASFSLAKSRLDRILSNPLADGAEGIWLIEEFIVICLTHKYFDAAKEALEKISHLNKSKKFRFIEYIIFNKTLSDDWYFDAVAELTPRQLGTLLRIAQVYDQSANLIHYQNLFIQSLNQNDKKFWGHLFKNQHEIKISNQLTLQGNNLILSDHKTVHLTDSFLEILNLFKTNSQLEVEMALKTLWNSSCNQAEISRLRMRIVRLNKYMLTEMALPKFISLNKEFIKLNYNLKFNSSFLD